MSESNKHKCDKRLVEWCASELGFISLGNEVHGGDVVVIADTHGGAFECERHARNAIRNVLRNQSSGLSFTIIVTPSFAVIRDVAQKLHKDLPPELWNRVGLLTMDTLRLLAGVTNKQQRTNN